jgi:hypothetical protein
MRQFCTIITLLGLLGFTSAKSQNFRYRNNTFKWPNEKPALIETNSNFSDEEAIIVDEETSMFIQDGVLRTNLNNIYVKKYFRLRFNTQSAINKFKTINLPESLYLQGDYAGIAYNKKQVIHRPKGDYECMDYFAARIIKPDGKVIPAAFNDSISVEQLEWNLKTYSYYAFHFIMNNLEPGDDLEVNYGCKEIYTVNCVFFHGILPKQHVKINVHYNANKYKYYFIEHNEATGIRSKVADSKFYNEKHTWEFSNLPACMDEPGSRPYLELPYFTFYKHDLDFGIWNTSRTVLQEYLPYTWDYVNLYFVNYKDEFPKLKLSRMDNATISVRNFVAEVTENISDTASLEKITKIHNYITRDFKYQRDDAFYSGEDSRLSRIAEFISKKTVREISRYDLYDKIMERLGFDYYKTFLFDKRINVINFDQYEESYIATKYYAILHNNNVNYFIPKYHRFGRYLNELPFYHEDNKLILIPQTVSYEESYKNVKTISYAFLNSPFSTITENTRNSNVLVSISLDSLKTTFSSGIKLSGQYSTMCRGSYLFDFVDTTANFQYAEKIYENLNGIGKVTQNTVKADTIFPFATEFNLVYGSHKIVEKYENSSYKIDLSNWFKHILESEVTSKKRDLAYYPDFIGQDRYKYFLKFDYPVNITSQPEPVEFISPYCVYKFNIVQVQPDVIMIESSMILKSDMVPVQNVGDIETVNKAILAKNNSELIVSRIN